MKSENIKNVVKEKYTQIARENNANNPSSCCGPATCCGSNLEVSMIGDEYNGIEGYNPDADLGLGCGVPTEFAAIKAAQHVLDLGSGAGNDCFVLRTLVGDKGHVTGLDFSEEMVAKARQNIKKIGYSNMHFVTGDIEAMPLEANRFDVVISNCVLNLVPHKNKAFTEIRRVLKPGGHFCVSDVVIKGQLPEKLRADAEMYAGCVSGALEIDEYLETITKSGFHNIEVHKQRSIEIPGNILKKYLDENDLKHFISGDKGVFSITISAFKAS